MNRLGLFLSALIAGAAATATAQPPIPTVPRTPPMVKLTHETPQLKYEIKIRPGAPQPGKTVNIEVSLLEKLEQSDPTYGTRKPIDDAELTAVLVSPAKKKKSKWSDVRLGFKLRDAGTYGVTFTPPKEKGIYGLHLRGTAGTAGAISHSVAIPYGVWPVPKDAKVPPAPGKLGKATVGNIQNGRLLCDAHCKKDLGDALPAGKTPVMLRSRFAESLDDGKLLTEVLGAKAKSLSDMERIDLLFYLRSLHLRVRDFFPSAVAFTANEFTINEYGKERLDEHKIKLDGKTDTAKVFIVYKGEDEANPPTYISYDDRVARDRLNKKDKIGYLIFFTVPGEKRAAELGLAMGLEPTYPILGAIARSANGKQDGSYNKALRSLKGQGKFNDPKSLKRASSTVRTKLTPIYMRAAELATMYYADEREFTAFDDEFN